MRARWVTRFLVVPKSRGFWDFAWPFLVFGFPALWWYQIITGAYDMSAPFTKAGAHDNPWFRTILRWAVLVGWSGLAGVLLLVIVKGQAARVYRGSRERSRKHTRP
jgi:hypothetical protein